MANDTTKKPDVKDAAGKAQDKATSGHVGPAPDLTAKTPDAPATGDKANPAKVVTFEKPGIANEGKAAQASPKKAVQDKAAKAPEKTPAKGGRAQKEPPKAKAPRQKPAAEKKAPPQKAKPGKAAIGKAKPEKAKQEEPPLENPFTTPSNMVKENKNEKVVWLDVNDVHPFHTFREHPYKVKHDAKMAELVESIKANGVMQPGLARPEKDGKGFEGIAGHRRREATILAGLTKMPFIVRGMTDLEAVRAMKDSNKQRDEDLPSEKARMLDLELEALKHQGARDISKMPAEHQGKRSNEIVAMTNSLTVKQVQRYIRLTKLTPELLDMVDDKKIGFTPAVEISYIGTKNQQYIAVAIEGQQSAPSLSQAQRMRELDQKGLLNADVVDGILLEEKKEVDKVVINTNELNKYFGKEITPRQMKDQILKLLDEWKGQQKDIAKPERKTEQEK